MRSVKGTEFRCEACATAGRNSPVLARKTDDFLVEIRTARWSREFAGADETRAVFEVLDGGKQATLTCPHQACRSRSRRGITRRSVQVTAPALRRLASTDVTGTVYI